MTLRPMELVSKYRDVALDGLAWSAARGAVDAVRYQPAHTKLLMACSASQDDGSQRVVGSLAALLARPGVARGLDLPHRGVRAIADVAGRWFGPTGSALVRFSSGAIAAAADRLSAVAVERVLRARVHPGLLVPHGHDAAVLAVDMRGFSQLTLALDDTHYLAALLEEYLTALTAVVERHRGVVFQYTGDGLLALFIAELAGGPAGAMLDRLVNEMCPALHREFDTLHARWREDWRAQARPAVTVGLGAGLSFGRVTMGYIGPYGKKQFGALGEPVNLAALLCAEADAGAVLIDRGSFERAGFEPLRAKTVRLRSRKLRRRLEAVCLHFGERSAPRAFTWLPTVRPPSPADAF